MSNRARLAARAAAVVATSALVLGFTIGPASADPIDDAREEVAALEMEAAAVDQDYAAAQDRRAKAEERLATKQADLQKQRDKVASMRDDISRIALAQYQGRHLDPTTRLLMSADSDSFMSRYATVEKVNDTQNSTLQQFQTEQANLADLERATEAEVAEVGSSEAAMAEARARSEQKLAEAQAVLDRLTEEERARIAAEERAAAEAAAAAAEAAAAETAEAESDATDADADQATDDAGTEADEEADESADEPSTAVATPKKKDKKAGKSGGSTTTVSSGSGRAADAVAFAKAQIGKPYGYGSTGPGSYDCSGLTGAAWRSAGVSLPRTSQAQYGAGRSVSVSQLQPGDLVFYYGGISHVGMYVGGGQIVHASRPGKPIGYAPVDSMPIAGARRVG